MDASGLRLDTDVEGGLDGAGRPIGSLIVHVFRPLVGILEGHGELEADAGAGGFARAYERLGLDLHPVGPLTVDAAIELSEPYSLSSVAVQESVGGTDSF